MRPAPPGEQTLVSTERHVEALSAEGLESRTLRRLIADLARAHRPDLEPTTPEITRLLSARISGASIGTARAFDDAVGRLRRAGTEARALRALRTERGAWLAQLMEEADRVLATRDLRDDRREAWDAAASLSSDAEGRELPGAVRIRGLTYWDRATEAFALSLHQKLRQHGGSGVVIELPQLDLLGEACQVVASELESSWADEADHPALEHLEGKLPSQVECIQAQDAPSEARAVAREVLTALERGARLERIAIVPVDLSERFLEPLRDELRGATIPFVEPRGRPAIASARAHTALEMLRMARGPLVRDTLVDVLRAPGLRLKEWFGEGTGGLFDLLRRIERLPLRVERGESDLVTELLEHGGLSARDPERAALLSQAQRGLSGFLEDLAEIGSHAPRARHATRIALLLQKMGLGGASLDLIERALRDRVRGSSALLNALGEDSLSMRALGLALERSALAAAALGLEADSVTLAEYLEEVELSLEGVSPARGAARAGAVRVMRPAEAAGLKLDLLVLCRATDEALDKAESADPVLGRVERELPARVRPVSPQKEQSAMLASLSWALLGTGSAVVTSARYDEGLLNGPSRLFRALAQAGRLRHEPASPMSPDARPARSAPALSPGAEARIQIELRRARFFTFPDHEVDPYSGDAGGLGSFFVGDESHPVSVTALERARVCPFLGFTDRVLRATRPDPATEGMGARERGILLHEALAAALEATRRLGADAPPAERLAGALEGARRALEGHGSSPLRRAALDNTLLDVEAMLRLEIAQGLGFFAAEIGFGAEATWPPLPLAGLNVSGRIDRIDRSTDGQKIHVIDYKTRAKIDESVQLQPWLYAHKAALELGARQVRFSYLGLEGRRPRLRQMYEGDPEGEPVEDARARAAETLEALRSGRLPPRPASTSTCVRCDARDVCRRPLSAPEPSES